MTKRRPSRSRTKQGVMSSPADFVNLKPIAMQVVLPHRGKRWMKLIAATDWERHSFAYGVTKCNGDELRQRDSREEITKAFIEAGRRVVFKKNDMLWWERQITPEEMSAKRDET